MVREFRLSYKLQGKFLGLFLDIDQNNTDHI